jgi:hypothetical protein
LFGVNSDNFKFGSLSYIRIVDPSLVSTSSQCCRNYGWKVNINETVVWYYNLDLRDSLSCFMSFWGPFDFVSREIIAVTLPKEIGVWGFALLWKMILNWRSSKFI